MSTVKADARVRTSSSSQEKSVLHILLELVYFTVLLVPNILIGFLRRFWPPECKSLDGLVVLVGITVPYNYSTLLILEQLY
jgi:hypothetical protein